MPGIIDLRRQNPWAQMAPSFVANMLMQQMATKSRQKIAAEQTKIRSEERLDRRDYERKQRQSELLSKGYQIQSPQLGSLPAGGQAEGFYRDPYLGADIKRPPEKGTGSKTGTIEIQDPESGKPALFETFTQDGRIQVGKRLGMKPVKGEKVDPAEALKTATGLRKEFTNQSKVFVDVRDAYGRVLASKEDPSAAGDLALIFNYMKILDPGSVVRESEFANAENTGSIPQRIWAKYNKVLEGERLSPKMRQDFVGRAGRLYKKQTEGHKQLRGEYSRISRSYKVKPENVIVDYIMKPEKEIKVGNKLVPAHKQKEAVKSLYDKYGLNPDDL